MTIMKRKVFFTGFGLVHVLAVSSVVSALTVATMKLLTVTTKANKSLQQTSQIQTTQRVVSLILKNQMACSNTFGGEPATVGLPGAQTIQYANATNSFVSPERRISTSLNFNINPLGFVSIGNFDGRLDVTGSALLIISLAIKYDKKSRESTRTIQKTINLIATVDASNNIIGCVSKNSEAAYSIISCYDLGGTIDPPLDLCKFSVDNTISLGEIIQNYRNKIVTVRSQMVDYDSRIEDIGNDIVNIISAADALSTELTTRSNLTP